MGKAVGKWLWFFGWLGLGTALFGCEYCIEGSRLGVLSDNGLVKANKQDYFCILPSVQ